MGRVEKADGSVNALLAFKASIFDDPLSRLANWNSLDEDPCDWSGVVCWPDHGNVISLDLYNSSLRGFLAPELGLLAFLQTLNLSRNNIIGTIPKEIGKLSHLNILDLSRNQLSGPVPNEVGNLNSITKIWLQCNQLTGNLPPELGNLKSLVELRLKRNRFRGPLHGSGNHVNFTSSMQGLYSSTSSTTGLCLSNQLSVADFSDNFFTGKVPSCLNYLPRSSFEKNCFVDNGSIGQRSTKQCGPTKYVKGHSGGSHENKGQVVKKKSSKWLLAVEIATGVVTGCLLLYIVGTAFFRCKDKQTVNLSWRKSSGLKLKELPDYEMAKGVLKMGRQELDLACEEFSNIIGSSADSVVYKGTMKRGPEIAVISLCIAEDYWTNYLDRYFQTEVADLARLNHENVAKLLGYCSENEPFSRMLIFEYASNGTLYEHLHYGEGCHLSWTKRMKIVVGVARGLRYMHCELQESFTLKELNSSAVYLTEDFSPKLVDFESWKAILSRSEKNSGSVSYTGYSSDSFGTFSSDIQGNTFSFGVLLLEIISGRLPYCKEKGCLVDWARDYLDMPEVIAYLVDPQLTYFRYEDVRVICEVVNLCIQPDPANRPSMTIICSMLENGIDISPTANIKESPLAWAELALAS
ncbi:putative LRR receptor-like serine/threonine-protein kinase [Nymphaea thermarum]|nr:putative LRR receptor-like serine/threonine-protein kinase [Nymphaea thermarum]